MRSTQLNSRWECSPFRLGRLLDVVRWFLYSQRFFDTDIRFSPVSLLLSSTPPPYFFTHTHTSKLVGADSSSPIARFQRVQLHSRTAVGLPARVSKLSSWIEPFSSLRESLLWWNFVDSSSVIVKVLFFVIASQSRDFIASSPGGRVCLPALLVYDRVRSSSSR